MRRALLGVGVVAALLAGCGQKPEASSPPTITAFDQRAEKVAQAWRAAGIGDAFVPTGGLTQAPAEGFPSDELKIAFVEGRFTLAATLPAGPGKGTIRYPDGKQAEVPVITAESAFRAVDKTDPAAGQAALEVTAAQAGTTKLQTTRGLAEVPAWKFTIKGIDHPVVQVAVAPEAVKTVPAPPTEPVDPESRLVSAQDLTAVTGNTVDYRLGVGSCDKDIVPLVWESDDIIVIGGRIGEPFTGMCDAMLKLHPVQVTLRKPAGARAILDILSGSPPQQLPS